MFMVALHLLGGAISLPGVCWRAASLPSSPLFVASWLTARRARPAVDVMVARRQE